MRLFSANFDETTVLPSGYTYVKTGDLRLNPQNPPLVKLLAGLPLLALHPRLDLDHPGWTRKPPDEWSFGRNFLYSNDADRLLFWGRFPMVLLGVALGPIIFLWGRDLFGTAGGLTALFLYAFSPNVVAHSRWVATDVPLACFFTLTLYLAWRFVRKGGRLLIGATGVSLGLALATKFSAVILPPLLALLFLLGVLRPPEDAAPAFRGRRRSRRRARRERSSSLAHPFSARRFERRLGLAALALAGIGAVALGVVWAAYLFPANPIAAYWEGISHLQADHNPNYEFFLFGEYRAEGWPHYFLAAFLIKTPLPTVGLFALALAGWLRLRTRDPLDEAFLVVPTVAFVAMISLFAHNIGLRYILPVYPLLFVFIGRLGSSLFTRRAGRVVAATVAVWTVVNAIRIYPEHLACFNELVGGPAQGHRYLDDSNIDWGGDLKRLKRWMDDHDVEEVHLRYFSNGSPGYYGIRAKPVPESAEVDELEPGYYAVSTHSLVRDSLTARRRGLRTDWLDHHEPIDRVGYSFFIFRIPERDSDSGAEPNRPAGAS